MNRPHLLQLAAAAGLLAASTLAQADKALVLTGIDLGGESTFGYAGLVVKPIGTLGESGLLLRGWVSRHDFDFGTSSSEVDVLQTSGYGAVGYQWVQAKGRLTGYVGATTRKTEARLGSASDDDKDSGYMLQLDAQQDFAAVRVEAITYYASEDEDYWGRVRVLRPVDSYFLGAELISQGNENYHAWRVGAVQSGLQLPFGVSLDASAGYENFDANRRGGYFSTGFAIAF